MMTLQKIANTAIHDWLLERGFTEGTPAYNHIYGNAGLSFFFPLKEEPPDLDRVREIWKDAKDGINEKLIASPEAVGVMNRLVENFDERQDDINALPPETLSWEGADGVTRNIGLAELNTNFTNAAEKVGVEAVFKHLGIALSASAQIER